MLDARREPGPGDTGIPPLDPADHRFEAAPRALRVGLLNNMPDAALAATERQFRRLLDAAGQPVALSLFTLDGLERGEGARAWLAGRYASQRHLHRSGLDALIVTGCEPRAGDLAAEPYFASLARVIDWARAGTVSTLFSCLAAHAAVRHLDGLRRVPLPEKCWGVFGCRAAEPGHPLLAGAPPVVPVPHSRWNDLPEADLRAAGYTVLRRSDRAGVDLFAREAGSLFVFLQGHPEYDGDSLAREHRRDVGRYLDGTRDTCPPLPEAYFAPAAARTLAGFAQAACRDPARVPNFPRVEAAPPAQAAWQAEAARLFRAWLGLVARRVEAAREPAVPA